MLFDDIRKDSSNFIKEIYRFLNVNDSYKPNILNKKTNESGRSQIIFPFINKAVYSLYDFIKQNKFSNKILNYSKKTKFYIKFRRKFLKILYRLNKKEVDSEWKKPEMKKSTRKNLINYYLRDIEKLEKITNKNLNKWKKHELHNKR
jgi:hypothetical protein